jgi:hypothetical protein
MAEWGLKAGHGAREKADRILTIHAAELADTQRTAIEATDDPVYTRMTCGWLPDLISPYTEETTR